MRKQRKGNDTNSNFNWSNKANRDTLEAINELENGRGTTTYDTVEEAMEDMLRIAKG